MSEQAHAEGGHGKKAHYDKLDNHHGGGHGGAHAEEGEGPWLMSFADMVTLLMCFFILFFTTEAGNIKLDNPDELLKKLEQLEKILAQEEAAATKDPTKLRTPSGAYGSLDAFKQDLKRISKDLDLVFSVGTPQPGEVELTFLNTHFFKSGEAELTPMATKMLEVVSQKLLAMDKDALINVEGHTDADPIKSRQYPSNWELSGARAATVVRLLQKYGLSPSRMEASGLAHYRPIAPEKDDKGKPIHANKALNRRIVIRVKTPALDEKQAAAPPAGRTKPRARADSTSEEETKP
jgi:chemotaxis protein MotB